MPQRRVTDDVLQRARTFYARRRYAEAIRLLEPEVYRYRESFSFYYLLGMSCLRTGDVGGGYSYLRRAEQLEPGNTEVLIAIAAVYIRRGETERAVNTYLAVLEDAPGHRIAQRGLADLRRALRRADSEPVLDAGDGMQRLLPPLPFRVPPALIVAAVVMVLSVAVLGGVLALRDRWAGPFAGAPGGPPGLAAIELPGPEPSFVVAPATGDPARYRLTDNDVRRSFEAAKRQIRAERDNLARIEINRIKLSNATAAVKERATQLEAFLVVPDFATVRDSVPLATVLEDPPLYHGIYVRWAGLVANLRVTEQAIDFDLLVGYHTREVLEGQVPVTLRFAALLDNGQALEVLGQLAVTGERVRVRGRSIHQLLPPAPQRPGP